MSLHPRESGGPRARHAPTTTRGRTKGQPGLATAGDVDFNARTYADKSFGDRPVRVFLRREDGRVERGGSTAQRARMEFVEGGVRDCAGDDARRAEQRSVRVGGATSSVTEEERVQSLSEAGRGLRPGQANAVLGERLHEVLHLVLAGPSLERGRDIARRWSPGRCLNDLHHPRYREIAYGATTAPAGALLEGDEVPRGAKEDDLIQEASVHDPNGLRGGTEPQVERT